MINQKLNYLLLGFGILLILLGGMYYFHSSTSVRQNGSANPTENGGSQKPTPDGNEITPTTCEFGNLSMTETFWNGDGVPDSKPALFCLDVKVGDVITPKRYERKYTFTVKEMNDESITIETNQAFSIRGEDGSINLNSTQTTFVMEKEKEVELTTPTMDYGDIYKFYYQ